MTEAHGAEADGRSLGEWVRLVLRRWPILVASVLIGIVVGLIAAATSPTLYEARTTLVLSPATGVLDPNNATDLPVLAATVARLADDETVSASVGRRYSQRLGAEGVRSLEWLREHVEARVPSGTSLVQLTARAESPRRAAVLAEVSADALIAEIGRLAPNGRPALNVEKFGTTADLGKVSPRPRQSVLLWANAALLLGIIVALTSKGGSWADRFTRKRRSADGSDSGALAGTAAVVGPVVGDHAGTDVVEIDRAAIERFAGLADSEPEDLVQLWDGTAEPGLEELRGTLLRAGTDGRRVVGVIGSARAVVLRGIATELAGHLVLGGASCAVVDANFHPDPGDRDADEAASPILQRRRGLGDVLDRTVSLDAALIDIPLTAPSNGSPNHGRVPLAILPAGNPPIDLVEALTSTTFRDVLVALRDWFDHVIVVAPPARWQKESVAVAGVTDANLMVLSNHLSQEAGARPLVAVGLVKPVR